MSSMRSRSRMRRQKRLRRTAQLLATNSVPIGKHRTSGRLLRQSRAADVAARFLGASEERVLLAKSLARTLADTHMVEQRLKDMQLLHQRIEQQNQQLRMILAIHKSLLEAWQSVRQDECRCNQQDDPSP